jgi:hypothetical protein
MRKKLLERLFGPLGGPERLSPGVAPESQGWRWGYQPTDQRRALRGFWILFGSIVAINVLVGLSILLVRVFS